MEKKDGKGKGEKGEKGKGNGKGERSKRDGIVTGTGVDRHAGGLQPVDARAGPN